MDAAVGEGAMTTAALGLGNEAAAAGGRKSEGERLGDETRRRLSLPPPHVP